MFECVYKRNEKHQQFKTCPKRKPNIQRTKKRLVFSSNFKLEENKKHQTIFLTFFFLMMFSFLLLCSEAAMLRDLTDVIKAQLALQDRRKCVKEKICGFVFFKLADFEKHRFFHSETQRLPIEPRSLKL